MSVMLFIRTYGSTMYTEREFVCIRGVSAGLLTAHWLWLCSRLHERMRDVLRLSTF